MRLTLLAAAVATTGAALWTGPATAQSLSGAEQAEVRAIVRDYLINNPDVLEDALDALQARKDAERRVRIENDSRDFSIGPRDASITIVEFFDYRCPYCHAAMEWVREAVETRDDVRLILKEMPVLSPQSIEAARAATAAKPQGQYWAFHQALMSFTGDLTSDRIDQLARQSGIDVARMRRNMDADNQAITEHLQDIQGQAVDLAGSQRLATPVFLINGVYVAGFDRARLDEVLASAVRDARSAKR